eukprot:GHVQ01032929.1.p1 GENE.GHVQ01032929.1~~GHVQ01032929.1.p1  ORF type:complete len:520 (-),score=46.90 GHVQ01032929.1:94-1653(-)
MALRAFRVTHALCRPVSPCCARRHITIYPCPHNKRSLAPATPVVLYKSAEHGTLIDLNANVQNSGSSAGKLLPRFQWHSMARSSRNLKKTNRYLERLSEGSGTANGTADRPLTVREVELLKKTFHFKIWRALYTQRWDMWEQLFNQFRQFGLPYDEVSYTLKLHGYVLSHRHKSENAYLVLEEMKAAQMHPAVIRLNEGLLNSYFELHGIFCGPMRAGWQSLCRVTWHTAVRLRRKRQKRFMDSLYQLPHNEVLSMDKQSVHAILQREYMEAMAPPPAALGDDSHSTLLEVPYEYEKDSVPETNEISDEDCTDSDEEISLEDVEKACETLGISADDVGADVLLRELEEQGVTLRDLSRVGSQPSMELPSQRQDVYAPCIQQSNLEMQQVFGSRLTDEMTRVNHRSTLHEAEGDSVDGVWEPNDVCFTRDIATMDNEIRSDLGFVSDASDFHFPEQPDHAGKWDYAGFEEDSSTDQTRGFLMNTDKSENDAVIPTGNNTEKTFPELSDIHVGLDIRDGMN